MPAFWQKLAKIVPNSISPSKAAKNALDELHQNEIGFGNQILPSLYVLIIFYTYLYLIAKFCIYYFYILTLHNKK